MFGGENRNETRLSDNEVKDVKNEIEYLLTNCPVAPDKIFHIHYLGKTVDCRAYTKEQIQSDPKKKGQTLEKYLAFWLMKNLQISGQEIETLCSRYQIDTAGAGPHGTEYRLARAIAVESFFSQIQSSGKPLDDALDYFADHFGTTTPMDIYI